MKPINVLSIIQGHRNLSTPLFQKLMTCYGIDPIKGIRDYEIDGIESLFAELFKCNSDVSCSDSFYLGFSIPQIGKEFDLLRFGKEYIINIEIKSEFNFDKIYKQQIRNNYYLSFLKKEIYIYTYVSSENKLFRLVHSPINSSIQEVNISELSEKLLSQSVITFNDIDTVFNPSDYLISPFNSTDKFIDGNYFLTIQQEKIYNEIQDILSDPDTNFVAITGNAGTGKTLLTYHIAKECIKNGLNILILHCAQLNSGHQKLIDNWGWNIYMTRQAPDYTDYDLIIVDEAQRMYPSQFTRLVDAIRSLNKKCVFSYDAKQYLSENERRYDIKNKIEVELGCLPFRLTDKIRTNKEISYFIKQLFNKNRNDVKVEYLNITFDYCKDSESAKALLNLMHQKNWKTPNYTPGTRTFFSYEKYKSDDSDSAHSVIGQEFENVVIVIDKTFNYNPSGELVANNNYYSQKQMLYQIITRAVKKLHIIILDNETMLDRCIQILSQ